MVRGMASVSLTTGMVRGMAKARDGTRSLTLKVTCLIRRMAKRIPKSLMVRGMAKRIPNYSPGLRDGQGS